MIGDNGLVEHWITNKCGRILVKHLGMAVGNGHPFADVCFPTTAQDLNIYTYSKQRIVEWIPPHDLVESGRITDAEGGTESSNFDRILA